MIIEKKRRENWGGPPKSDENTDNLKKPGRKSVENSLLSNREGTDGVN